MLNFQLVMDCLKFHECELCERTFTCEYDKHVHNSWVRKSRVNNIKKVLLVNSVKNGLGCTAFACSFASELVKNGLRTAVIETSLFSSMPDYLGHDFKKGVEIVQDGIVPPVSEYGFMYLSPSIFMGQDRKPLLWNSEAVVKFTTKMIVNTNWGELDVLIMDMPSCQTGLLKEIKTFFGKAITDAVLLVDFKDPNSEQALAHSDYVKELVGQVHVFKSPSKVSKGKAGSRTLPFIDELFVDGTKQLDVVKAISDPYSHVLKEVVKLCL